jgi:hypothetical protein
MLIACSLLAIAVYAWVEVPALKALRPLLIRRRLGAAVPLRRPDAVVVSEVRP